GGATPEQMRECFDSRTKLNADDTSLGSELWNAFHDNGFAALQKLSSIVSPAFPCLNEVCEAAIEKESRPGEIVRQIQSQGITDLNKLFPEFKKRAGVYGFGDTQVKRLLSEPPAVARG